MNEEKILTKQYLINGPNNVIRLTDGNKILYIFSDEYYPISYQNECSYDENYDSLDIDKFLLKFIKTEKNKNFDLFGLFKDDEIIKPYNYSRGKYADNLKKIFQFNIKKNNDEIKTSIEYPNFRYHFISMYHSLENFDYIYDKFNILLFRNSNILSEFEDLIYHLDKFYKFITNDIEIKKHYYINKILNEYEDNNIKKKINNIFNKIIINFKNIINEVKNLFNFAKKNILNYSYENFSIENLEKLEKLYELYFNYDCFINVLCSLYFLRRFLDKKYIKNSIIYTKSINLNNISYLLVKYFNFKITNIFICDPKFEIKNEIKKLKFDNFEYIHTLLKHTIGKQNYEHSQCVNLFNFPENFN